MILTRKSLAKINLISHHVNHVSALKTKQKLFEQA